MKTTMNKTDKAITKYCDMMIKTISELEQGWRKTWLTTKGTGLPTNMDGRAYNAMNRFMLYLVGEEQGYDLPVWLTLHRANELGAHVLKGQKSTPVLFWSINAYKDGKRITLSELNELPEAEQKGWKTSPVLRCYDVFNVAQTSLEKDNPKAFAKISERYDLPEMKGEDGMYVSRELDALIGGGWVCPIITAKQNRAFYNPADDCITLPLKAQFNTEDNLTTAGQEFYSTALHEMAHSTGAASRLNRKMSGGFGSEDYGREELVAELTAALCGHSLGFNPEVQQNNAAYLKGWLQQIKEQPKFLVSVLADVSKATGMIDEAIAKVG